MSLEFLHLGDESSTVLWLASAGPRELYVAIPALLLILNGDSCPLLDTRAMHEWSKWLKIGSNVPSNPFSTILLVSCLSCRSLLLR